MLRFIIIISIAAISAQYAWAEIKDAQLDRCAQANPGEHVRLVGLKCEISGKNTVDFVVDNATK